MQKGATVNADRTATIPETQPSPERAAPRRKGAGGGRRITRSQGTRDAKGDVADTGRTHLGSPTLPPDGRSDGGASGAAVRTPLPSPPSSSTGVAGAVDPADVETPIAEEVVRAPPRVGERAAQPRAKPARAPTSPRSIMGDRVESAIAAPEASAAASATVSASGLAPLPPGATGGLRDSSFGTGSGGDSNEGLGGESFSRKAEKQAPRDLNDAAMPESTRGAASTPPAASGKNSGVLADGEGYRTESSPGDDGRRAAIEAIPQEERGTAGAKAAVGTRRYPEEDKRGATAAARSAELLEDGRQSSEGADGEMRETSRPGAVGRRTTEEGAASEPAASLPGSGVQQAVVAQQAAADVEPATGDAGEGQTVTPARPRQLSAGGVGDGDARREKSDGAAGGGTDDAALADEVRRLLVFSWVPCLGFCVGFAGGAVVGRGWGE